jgi:hypothetical protein
LPPAPAPRVEDVADDERAVFAMLESTRRRFLGLSAHGVLDVAPGADADTVRVAFLARAARLHPDRFRRYRSAALRALALDTYLHVRRARDRMLGLGAGPFLVAAGAALESGTHEAVPVAPAPAMSPSALTPGPSRAEVARAADVTPALASGVDTDAPAVPAAPAYDEITITVAAEPDRAESDGPGYDEELTFTTSVRSRALTAEELFDDDLTDGNILIAAPPTLPPGAELLPAGADLLPPVSPVPTGARPPSGGHPPVPTSPPQSAAEPPAAPPVLSADAGRAALAEGRFREACELFAAVLRVEPRNRQLRALYHVASGLELRQKGDGVRAQIMFETALAHDRECVEARRALAHEPAPDPKKSGLFRRLFDR